MYLTRNYGKVFGYLCRNGHLEEATWLLQAIPNVNISAENEYAFRQACYSGHLEVAKWLLTVSPTIINDSFSHWIQLSRNL